MAYANVKGISRKVGNTVVLQEHIAEARRVATVLTREIDFRLVSYVGIDLTRERKSRRAESRAVLLVAKGGFQVITLIEPREVVDQAQTNLAFEGTVGRAELQAVLVERQLGRGGRLFGIFLYLFLLVRVITCPDTVHPALDIVDLFELFLQLLYALLKTFQLYRIGGWSLGRALRPRRAAASKQHG